MDKTGKYIGHRLRKARMRMGFSQVQVMHALGLKSPNRISQWEKGRRIPSIKNILKLSILYQTLPDDLFYELRQEIVIELKRYTTSKNHPP